ncbi:unnamed protein product, partial [Mesorhabditis belari]|uniref:Trafficking protein particle complex subunit 13 n=1 Tax=Mesorhabditis belari TaxID=2138241 RepID=A0AAF3EVM6_9BILA
MADLQGPSQTITLKVMRLARPKFAPFTSLCVDPEDDVGRIIQQTVQRKTIDEGSQWPIGDFILAPQQFENIYLGETFTFYVSCINEGNDQVDEVTVKVDLQTNSQKQPLPCKLDGLKLVAGESQGQVVSHEVKELGQHILVCSVTYKTSSGSSQYFRKFFKFPVTKPIDVRTKFYNAESNDVFLEAQIENTSGGMMMLERVVLEPSDFYDSQAITPSPSAVQLRPKDVRQFLFCLTPKNHGISSPKEVTNIGKLDMQWRTAMGERGRLQTSPLQRIAPGYGDTRLSVERVPATVRVRQTFEVMLRVHNCCDRSLDLMLSFDTVRQPGIVYCCTSGKSLGQIPPNTSIDFGLELLPVTLGFQSLSGIRIHDVFNKRTYEYDDIAQVFVN